MSRELSERQIVKDLAEHVAQRLTRRVIRDLRRIEFTLSGEGTELKNLWDEICVQFQFQESVCWEVYEETVQGILEGYVDELKPHERESLWLATDQGFDWRFEDDDSRESAPVLEEDIVEWLKRERISPEAEHWTNKRIRAYIRRASMRD